jgi:hypothetical protein
MRSIRRPAGNEVHAADTSEMAGPSPSNFVAPVTTTKVSADTAATICNVAEFIATVAARRAVFRRIGKSAISKKLMGERQF